MTGRSRLVVPQATNDSQARAADPAHSAWVSANAGSGKTKVLVDRVLRLLLRGIAPSRILCLTYTKATAAIMSNKVLAELAGWVRLEDEPLKEILVGLQINPDRRGETAITMEALVKARRLFAQALETPGGLKIETIHAFCTRVLQMAPFEANVPARFEVLDEAGREAMLDAARRQVIVTALQKPDSDLGKALVRLTRDAGSDDSFASILRQTLKSRALLVDDEGRPYSADQITVRLARALDVPAGLIPDDIGLEFQTIVDRLIDADHVMAVCAQGSKTDNAIANAARMAKQAATPGGALECWLDGLLTKDRAKILDRLGTKAVEKIDPLIPMQLADLAAHAMSANDRLKAAETLARTGALVTLATAIFARYDMAKAQSRMLDYDDLVVQTRSLLSRVGTSWVLYKLDAGIDHVLVDEAQDTTPEQWDILQALTAEFTAGHGARPGQTTRTMFAVGDQKQSIYGFQGAAPEQFDGMRRSFLNKTINAGQKFNDIQLSTSFRSVPDIIHAVDAVFAPREHWAGLTFEADISPQRHNTARINDSGAVDIWPLAVDDPADETDAWTLPVDAPERQHGNMRLARRIAAQIKSWSDAGQDDLGHAFSPGDVLILMRNRNALFETIVKALKDAGVPVAGRDRLKLAIHPAVEDLIVLGRAILLPEDDLALATLLKTPLFDLDDNDLQGFAPERQGSLRSALSAGAAQNPKLARAEEQFRKLAALAGRSGPFGFYASVLGPLGGRREAIRRLGAEAGDAVDAFLSAALDFERKNGPSQLAFLGEMASTTQDVKRDLAGAGSDVRVMTVHGAKGLESRIVILADIGVVGGSQKADKLLGIPVPGEVGKMPVPVWSPSKGTDTNLMAIAKAEALARYREEHNRLLYVALTRAEERLIVCGAMGKKTVLAGSWYETIERGLSASEAGLREITPPDGSSTFRRFKITPMAAPEAVKPAAPSSRPVLPAWLTRPMPVEQRDFPPLSPSSAIVAAERPDRPLDNGFMAAAASIGKFAHLLLQVLPGVASEKREVTAAALAAVRANALTEIQRQTIVTQATALLAMPDLAELFGPSGLAEVPIAGRISLAPGVDRLVSGQIDRLLIGPAHIVIADFKTSARPPRDAAAIPLRSLAQMAIYKALIADIFPGKTIRTLLIFTANLSVLEPDDTQLFAALASLGADGITGHTPVTVP
jgi:ATP-dependent helicase/nuclease subunit A